MVIFIIIVSFSFGYWARLKMTEEWIDVLNEEIDQLQEELKEYQQKDVE